MWKQALRTTYGNKKIPIVNKIHVPFFQIETCDDFRPKLLATSDDVVEAGTNSEGVVSILGAPFGGKVSRPISFGE
jgi:hypothetical protein